MPVYIVRADETGPVKIGWSNSVVKRMRAIKPTPTTELTIIRLLDVPRCVEPWLHQIFSEQRLNGEWFTFDERMLTIEPFVAPETSPGTLEEDNLCAADIERMATERGRTMQQVCADLGVAYTTFWRWRAGKGEPSLSMYRRLRDAVSTPTESTHQEQ